MGGLQAFQGVRGFFGARKARKKQERFIKKMMADRAQRIAAAKGQYDKSRRGLLAENRAAMQSALASAPMTLGPALMASTASGNLMRSVYRDYARRAAEISRQTAAGKVDLEMMSPYDIVDPSTIGQGMGAENAALGSALSGLAGFGGSLANAFQQYGAGKQVEQLGAAMQGHSSSSPFGNIPTGLGSAYANLGANMKSAAFGSGFGK